MNVYIYQAVLLCEDCARAKRDSLDRIAAEHGNAHHNYREDSDRYPQGPYSSGGGEADTPQHCDHCGVFLENPLTDDGRAYVSEAVLRNQTSIVHRNKVVDEWQEFYGITLED